MVSTMPTTTSRTRAGRRRSAGRSPRTRRRSRRTRSAAARPSRRSPEARRLEHPGEDGPRLEVLLGDRARGARVPLVVARRARRSRRRASRGRRTGARRRRPAASREPRVLVEHRPPRGEEAVLRSLNQPPREATYACFATPRSAASRAMKRAVAVDRRAIARAGSSSSQPAARARPRTLPPPAASDEAPAGARRGSSANRMNSRSLWPYVRPRLDLAPRGPVQERGHGRVRRRRRHAPERGRDDRPRGSHSRPPSGIVQSGRADPGAVGEQRR